MIAGGNMSKTIIKEDNGVKLFSKVKDVHTFDTRTLIFQTNMERLNMGSFNINKFKGIRIIPNEHSGFSYEFDFEYIDPKPWTINKESMEVIGKSMAMIHNYAYFNSSLISLNIKEEAYDSMSKWSMLTHPDLSELKVESVLKRMEIFMQIPRISTMLQPKAPLHRDFKPHNIISDGEKFYLIDFDFAAVDFISLEIGGFIVDIIDSGLDNVESFLKAYLSVIDVPILIHSVVDDYLNYLCTNNFPFYLSDSLDKDSLINLINHRNHSLDILWQNRDNVNDIIKNILYFHEIN